ncbi:MAG: sulfatase [Paenibacillaceae bacterium]|nr:sulfatase [Paenibacillaceae bacterium]
MNILIIMADQHRIDCLGAYGNPDIRTPAIDSLAADGIVFENSFCASPVCTPSRYSFLTGLYPHDHLGWGNTSSIHSGLPTFPKLLREKGYKTKAVGKMHFTPTYYDLGFSEMQLAEQNGPGRYEDDYHVYLMERGLADVNDLEDQVKEYREQAPPHYWESRGAIESNLPESDHSTAWIGEQALTALGQWEGDDNLLMVSFIKPHHPFDPPAPWSRMYDPDQLTILPGWTEESFTHDLRMNQGFFDHSTLTEPVLRKAMALYYGSISQIDDYVGRMIAALRAQGRYDDTLIIYTSDHGEYLGFHHMLLKSNYMYDPLVKVPLILKLPGNVAAGSRRDDLVSNIDIAPTLAVQAGVPHSFRGCDLTRPSGRDYVYAEINRGNHAMLRSHTRKLIRVRNQDMSLFFDLENDPLEMHNVYSEESYRAEVAAMTAELERAAQRDSALDELEAQSKAVTELAGKAGKDPEAAYRWFDERMKQAGYGPRS